MACTIEDAKKKTCPFMRYCTNERWVGENNEPAIYAHQNCEGDTCSAWVWADAVLGGCGLVPGLWR